MRGEKNERGVRAAARAALGRRSSSPEAGNDEKIATIHAGEGARVTTRKNASQAARRARSNARKRYLERHPEAKSPVDGPERSGKNIVLLVVLAIVALALLFLIVRCVAVLVTPDPAEEARQAAEQAQNEQNLSAGEGGRQDSEYEQAETGGSVTYNGDVFTLQMQDDGLWGVVQTDPSGNAVVLFKIEGAPVALARRMSTILVPENRDGGWDIVCYVVDGHSQAGYIVGKDGAAVRGSGDITSVDMSATTMRVSDSTGATTEVALV